MLLEMILQEGKKSVIQKRGSAAGTVKDGSSYQWHGWNCKRATHLSILTGECGIEGWIMVGWCIWVWEHLDVLNEIRSKSIH